MSRQCRWLIMIAAVLFTFLICFWLGEHNTRLVPLDHLLALLPAMFLSACLTWSESRGLALFLPLFVLVGGVCAWRHGSSERASALNDCLERCVHTQTTLEIFRRSQGVYPAMLEELNMHLPARVSLPPQILMYERTQEGYLIWIPDALMSYQGSHREEFRAHK